MTPISHKHNPKYLPYVKAGLIYVYIVANKGNDSLLLKDVLCSPLLEKCALEKRLRVCAQSIQLCLFVILWTVAHYAPLYGILQARREE